MTKAIELDPNDAAYKNRGIAYFLLKAYDKAIEDFETAIKMEPEKHFEPYQGLYEVYKELNQPEKAEKYLQKAIELGYKPEEE